MLDMTSANGNEGIQDANECFDGEAKGRDGCRREMACVIGIVSGAHKPSRILSLIFCHIFSSVFAVGAGRFPLPPPPPSPPLLLSLYRTWCRVESTKYISRLCTRCRHRLRPSPPPLCAAPAPCLRCTLDTSMPSKTPSTPIEPRKQPISCINSRVGSPSPSPPPPPRPALSTSTLTYTQTSPKATPSSSLQMEYHTVFRPFFSVGGPLISANSFPHQICDRIQARKFGIGTGRGESGELW